MSEATSGTFAVHENEFTFGIKGLASTETEMVCPKNLTTFTPSFDGNMEDWFAMDQHGWSSHKLTGKGLSFDFSGMRTIGDPGNDYLASLAFKLSSDVETKMSWNMPSGAKVEMDVIINVSNLSGGDTTNVGALEFTATCNGAPTFTPGKQVIE